METTVGDTVLDRDVFRLWKHTDHSHLDLHTCKYLQSFTDVHNKDCFETRIHLHTYMDTFRVQCINAFVISGSLLVLNRDSASIIHCENHSFLKKIEWN